jgi:outer membrane scaffolding protein for murein synthesis (MipA/OmpV family)
MEDTNEPTVYLGGGMMVSSKPYEGADMRLYPVPLFGYEGKRLYMRGVVGGYRLLAGRVIHRSGPSARFDG